MRGGRSPCPLALVTKFNLVTHPSSELCFATSTALKTSRRTQPFGCKTSGLRAFASSREPFFVTLRRGSLASFGIRESGYERTFATKPSPKAAEDCRTPRRFARRRALSEARQRLVVRALLRRFGAAHCKQMSPSPDSVTADCKLLPVRKFITNPLRQEPSSFVQA